MALYCLMTDEGGRIESEGGGDGGIGGGTKGLGVSGSRREFEGQRNRQEVRGIVKLASSKCNERNDNLLGNPLGYKTGRHHALS